MYFTNWDRFVQACSKLCDTATTQPRYCLRWRSSQSLLVIKVTDDITCIKFKTRSTVFLNRFDAFNRALMARFQNRQTPRPAVVAQQESSQGTSVTAGDSKKEGAIGEEGKEGGQEIVGVAKKKKKGKKKSKTAA
ncbi:hypothetical protein JCM16303_005559 [Sporobolomyces ruberrimus]